MWPKMVFNPADRPAHGARLPLSDAEGTAATRCQRSRKHEPSSHCLPRISNARTRDEYQSGTVDRDRARGSLRAPAARLTPDPHPDDLVDRRLVCRLRKCWRTAREPGACAREGDRLTTGRGCEPREARSSVDHREPGHCPRGWRRRHRRRIRRHPDAPAIQLPTDVIAGPQIQLDQRALMFSLMAAVASAFLFGLGPAIQTTRLNLVNALKSSEAGGDRRPSIGSPYPGRHSSRPVVGVADRLVLRLAGLRQSAVRRTRLSNHADGQDHRRSKPGALWSDGRRAVLRARAPAGTRASGSATRQRDIGDADVLLRLGLGGP